MDSEIWAVEAVPGLDSGWRIMGAMRLALFSWLFWVLGSVASAQNSAPDNAPNNVLLVLIDDAGRDRVAAYEAHPSPGRTPTLDRLAEQGVLFRNAWAAPLCSPSRARILTGRYGFRTGIGTNVINPSGMGLLPEEFTLAEAMKAGGHRTAGVGKWHLSHSSQWPMHPLQEGFDFWVGNRGNINDYYSHFRVVQGMGANSTRYATRQNIDDALRLIEGFEDDPWFVYLSVYAPHNPLHRPPRDLLEIPVAAGATDAELHKAMVEAFDTELARLLSGMTDSVRERTSVIFLGDNGTQGDAVEAPWDPLKAKGTLFEGGVGVPLIIAGAGVTAPGTECRALVDSTDLFATCLELAGIPLDSVLPQGHVHDSVSLVPYLSQPHQPALRPWQFAEYFAPNHPAVKLGHFQALRIGRYKLVHNVLLGSDDLYDLEADPMETVNLMLGTLTAEQEAAWIELRRVLFELDG